MSSRMLQVIMVASITLSSITLLSFSRMQTSFHKSACKLVAVSLLIWLPMAAYERLVSGAKRLCKSTKRSDVTLSCGSQIF